MNLAQFVKWLTVLGVRFGAAASVTWDEISGKPTFAAVATSGAYGDLSGRPSLATVATSGSYTDLSNKPVVGKVVTGTTVKTDAFRVYQNAVVASGVAVFQLTADGTAGGAALFANEVFNDSVGLIVNDAAASYQMGWAFSNSNRTLTVTCNKYTTANILSGILGQTAANGAVVRLVVEGR